MQAALPGDTHHAIEIMRSAMAKAEKIGWKNNRVWQVKLAKWPPPTLIPEIHEPVSLCWMKRLKHPTGPRHGISRPSYTSCEGKRLSRRPAPFSVKRLLRPAATLARLLRDQGRAAEAHEELAQVYSWFTEGLELLGSRVPELT